MSLSQAQVAALFAALGIDVPDTLPAAPVAAVKPLRLTVGSAARAADPTLAPCAFAHPAGRIGDAAFDGGPCGRVFFVRKDGGTYAAQEHAALWNADGSPVLPKVLR